MNLSPLISVIIPVYNGEKYLHQAIDSVLCQQYRAGEIIVIDDGSLDGTADVAAAFGQQVQYAYQPNAGPGAARNHGVMLAKGELLAFLDADDRWSPEKLQQQVAQLVQDPTLGYVICHMRVIQEAAIKWPVTLNQAYYQTDPPALLPSALLVRREIFQQVGWFNPHLSSAEDVDWFVRANDLGISKAVINKVLLYKRVHDQNLSTYAQGNAHNLLLTLRRSVQRKQAKVLP